MWMRPEPWVGDNLQQRVPRVVLLCSTNSREHSRLTLVTARRPVTRPVPAPPSESQTLVAERGRGGMYLTLDALESLRQLEWRSI